jgi:predicted phage terminase large subunit-like protein
MGMSVAERTDDLSVARLAAIWKPPRLRYLPDTIELSAKQELFLALTHREAFFGGAAGPGKSTALLAAALQYVDVPGYSALILRRTYADLSLPGALMDMAADWLRLTDARWSAGRVTWTFPSTATLTFGHLEHEEQKRRYASSRFQLIAFDELSQFTESQYTFLFSRLRRPAASLAGRAPDGLGVAGVPLRMRSASNPGGPGHGWVKRRLVDPKTRYPGAAFIPAKLIENRHLDVASYEESLAHLGPVERARLMRGDWEVTEDGGVFRATVWMADRWLDAAPSDVVRAVRFWDLAATEGAGDWSVGTLYGARRDGSTVVLDVQRFRVGPAELEKRLRATAHADGRSVRIGIEQEGGSAGKSLVSYYQRQVIGGGFVVTAERPTGDKETRAVPVASFMDNGNVWAVRGPWTREWLNELDVFGGDSAEHDDQVDSLSGAHTLLMKGGPLTTSVPRGRVPTTVVREPEMVREHTGPPATPNGDTAAADSTQGRPRAINRRGARRIDIQPRGTRGPGGGLP